MAGGLAAYRRVLGLPGALAFSGAGLVARMPMAMVSLGIVVLVSTRTGSYAQAGTVAAAFLVANALLAVVQARLIDRLGQGRVLPLAAVLSVTGLVGLMAAVEGDLGAPWPHLGAALAGATLPQIGSSIRARWSHLLEDRGDLHTAFAFESVVDEIVFVVGPALVTTLATAVHPLAGLATAAGATAVGTAVLVSRRASEPPAGGPRRRMGGRGLPWGVLAPLIGAAFALGVLLGGAEVATVAVSEELGSTALAGPMLAVWAVGSLLAGVVTGAMHPRRPNAVRIRWGLLALGLLMAPLPLVDGFLGLALFLFLSGAAISPTLIASFALIEESVPSGRITEGITLFTTGLGAGLAPGAALVGVVVERSGAATGYWVAIGAGLAGAAVALLLPSGRRVEEVTTTHLGSAA